MTVTTPRRGQPWRQDIAATLTSSLAFLTPMFDRILVVCTGNICRSPLAEALLRRQLADDGRSHVAQVRSAGTRVQAGQATDETVLYLAQRDLELSRMLQAHRAQPLAGTLTWWADLILVMEPHHVQRVVALDPGARSKVHLLGRWIRRPIADPYLKHESVYREAQELIQDAVLSWRNKISDTPHLDSGP